MDTKKDPFQNLQERMRNALADHSIRAFQELSSSTRDLMSCYRCAIMEIETKFRVLNERFSLQHDRNVLEKKIRLDPLTGVYNRYHLDGLLQQVHKDRGPLSVLMADVNGLKMISHPCRLLLCGRYLHAR